MKNREKDAFADMSYEDYLHWLPMLDWWYDYADSSLAYNRGREQVLSYKKLAQKNGPKWVEAFEAQQAKRYAKKDETLR
jgi:hypothetical protein